MSNIGDYSRKVRKSLARRIVNYILNGLLIAVPVAVTCYVVYEIFMFLDNLLADIIPGAEAVSEEPVQPPNQLNPEPVPETRVHKYPGAGIGLLLLFLLILGYVGSKLINEPIKRRFDRFLDRIPFIKTFYKSMGDVLGAFVGSKKRFDQPVLVRLSSGMDVEVIGFVTDKDLHELGENAIGKIAVYMPMSFSISGHLIIVPKENVIPIDRNAVDVMKYVISGGVVEIDHEESNGKV
jgi:uncharacterized membrane protein